MATFFNLSDSIRNFHWNNWSNNSQIDPISRSFLKLDALLCQIMVHESEQEVIRFINIYWILPILSNKWPQARTMNIPFFITSNYIIHMKENSFWFCLTLRQLLTHEKSLTNISRLRHPISLLLNHFMSLRRFKITCWVIPNEHVDSSWLWHEPSLRNAFNFASSHFQRYAGIRHDNYHSCSIETTHNLFFY